MTSPLSGSLFISDLHLCEERPQITALFGRFMDEVAHDAAALYILGDLFEYWIGDDQLDHDALAHHVACKIATAAARGTRVFFMHGNRDFLLGERFAAEASLTMLADPTVIDLDGERVLLMHGDTLCTDDVAYQQFRKQVRDPVWQAGLLAKPYPDRITLARSLRTQSDMEKSMKADAIMDVNADAVSQAFRQHGCVTMIHGHTHRPARHESGVDGKQCVRWVLADWHDSGGYLAATNGPLVAKAVL